MPDRLLSHPQLWRAGQIGSAVQAIASGFPALDEHLPGGGWPEAGLAELLLPTAGIGELRLLIPLLRTLSRQNRWIAWVAPPFVPYAPALAARGIDVRRLLIIQPPDARSRLWALELASRSGACSLVLGWPDERQLELADTRRLQLAAKRGRTLTCLFRPDRAAAGKSMAELRLRLKPDEAGNTAVDICKRRGGWPVSALPVTFDGAMPVAAENWLAERLAEWRQVRPQIPRQPWPARPSAFPDAVNTPGRPHPDIRPGTHSGTLH